MPIEMIDYEFAVMIIMILTIFGFFDRIFFIFGLLFNWMFALSLLQAGSIITDKVYNPVTSTWIVYTESVLTSNNVPTEYMLILIMLIVIDALLLIVRSGVI